LPPPRKRGNFLPVAVQIPLSFGRECDDRATISGKSRFAIIIFRDSLAKL
jgi:hypothetical protein